MKRSDLNQTLQTINLIRKEKTPPTAAYCILLALASSDQPMGSTDINKMLEETSLGGGTLDRMVEKGRIVCTKNGRNNIYSLTAAGWDEVRRLVEGKLPPTAQELRRAAIVPFNSNAKAS